LTPSLQLTVDDAVFRVRGTGKVVAAEWDLLGVGDYPVAGQLAAPGASVSVKTTYSYPKPGTYFPVLRVTSQRDGGANRPYARVQNLGRVRRGGQVSR
jgi:hypothetical protein